MSMTVLHEAPTTTTPNKDDRLLVKVFERIFKKSPPASPRPPKEKDTETLPHIPTPTSSSPLECESSFSSSSSPENSPTSEFSSEFSFDDSVESEFSTMEDYSFSEESEFRFTHSPMVSSTISSSRYVEMDTLGSKDFEDLGLGLQDQDHSLSESWAVLEDRARAHRIHMVEEDLAAHEWRVNQFLKLLSEPVRNLDALRTMSWNGIPQEIRATVWQLLLEYTPADVSLLESTVEAKRAAYRDLVEFHCTPEVMKEGTEDTQLHQIRLDVPRTIPQGVNQDIITNEDVKGAFERVLLVFSKENEDIDYFQGFGDITIHFFLVFLGAYLDVEHYSGEIITAETLRQVEADSYWCVSKVMEGMRVHSRPDDMSYFDGCKHMMDKMGSLIQMADESVHEHLQSNSIDLVHFSFRWMLCLLSREFPISSYQRLWDTYLAEGPASFPTFHIYVCAALALRWGTEIKNLDFGDSLVFLQHLPTTHWTDRDMGEMIRKAYTIGQLEKRMSEVQSLQVSYLGSVFFILFMAYLMSLLLAHSGYHPHSSSSPRTTRKQELLEDSLSTTEE